METENIDKQCDMCEDEANGAIKSSHNSRSIRLCSRCAKEVLWELVHHSWPFDDDD